VEVEPQQAGGEARVGRDGLADLLLHDDLRGRARAVVEPHPQLRAQPCRHHQYGHDRGSQAVHHHAAPDLSSAAHTLYGTSS
jgi:hypothetical protein